MKNIIAPVYETIVEKWGKEFKGMGSVKCLPPLDYRIIVSNVITKMRNKDADTDVFIIVKEYEYRKRLLEYFAENNIDASKISILTHSYISTKWVYRYKLVITIGLDEYDYLLEYVMSRCKFCMFIITDNLISSEKLSKIYNKCPAVINNFDSEENSALNICSPVEEHRIGCIMSNDDNAKYNSYCEFITKALNVFDNFDNIAKARVGDKDNNIGPDQYCYNLAISNGWSETLDMTVGFNRQIDECYNPSKLRETASTCYNIMRDRQNLCTDNDVKLEVIADILNELKDKQVIIISKRGEFAAKITQHLIQKGFSVGDYHDKIEDKLLVDDDGKPILYKSGINKGKPRIAKTQAISSANERLFNEKRINVLSIKNSSSAKLKTTCDAWIITSPLCDYVEELKYRFNNIAFNSTPNIIYRLFLQGTIEEKELLVRKPNNYTSIITKKVNIENSDENFAGIVCE